MEESERNYPPWNCWISSKAKRNEKLFYSFLITLVEKKGAYTMAAELDFSPPEIPEPTFMENVLRYGLFFGAIFQLICVLAIILPVSKSHKTDSDSFESKSSEAVKKPKATAPQMSKKPKKETKKKR
ncbi:protein MANBAL isoform X3 [Struthio camelus]